MPQEQSLHYIHGIQDLADIIYFYSPIILGMQLFKSYLAIGGKFNY